ncbi:MAG: PAS domain S-box protein [Proteobacteria bacterium]|nr:PAS domain S-box protein [Pseudomonadota bacterium]
MTVNSSKTAKQLGQELHIAQQELAELRAELAEHKEKAGCCEKATLYKAIADHSGEIQAFHGLDGWPVWINPAVVETIGYTAAECMAMEEVFPLSLTCPEDYEIVKETIVGQLERATLGGGLRHRLRCKDGRVIWLEVNWKPAFDEKGVHIGWRTVSHDVTNQVVLEEELRRERDFAATIVDTAQAIVLVLDPTGRIVSYNKYMEKLSGHSLDEMKGRDWFDSFLPGRDHQRIRALFSDALEDIQTHGNVNPILARDGREIDIEWYHKTLLDGEGNVGGVLCIGLDISHRRRAEAKRLELEAQVRHVQKLESLGLLAGGIAHDFNNILVGILGAASLASIQVAGDPALQELLRTIDKSARRAADLTSQMLAYAGKGRVIVEDAEVNQLVASVHGLLCSSLPKSCALKLNLEDELPLVRVDTTQIQQVIMNLVTNAAEAVGLDPGEVSVTTQRRTCDEDVLRALRPDEQLSPGEYVTISVCDSGGGMDEETQARIFDPFFTTKVSGRGLGLAAVYGILHGHRGAIEVESEPNKGTTFTIYLPVVRPAIKGTSHESTVSVPSVWMGSGTALIVDDERTVRRVAGRILEKIGFSRVLLASDGLEGVEVFREHHSSINVVLLDLDMPRLDGRATLARLRQINPEVSVVLCSGYGREVVEERFAGDGLLAFLEKPYTINDMRQKLRQVLEG